MNGEISPRAAVMAQTRREPAGGGAYDAALPRRQARDQAGGRLDATYVSATKKFLDAAGLDPADLDAIGKILDQYVEEAPAEDSENLTMAPKKTIQVGGPRGPIGAQDRRRFVYDKPRDQFGRPRSLTSPLSLDGDDRGFSKRFPEAGRIRTA